MQLSIQTSKKDEIIDITEKVEALLEKQSAEQGVLHLFAQHSTCALTVMDLDYGTDLDFLDAIRGMLPKLNYRHPHNPAHVPDHILSSIIGMSVTIPFAKKKLLLGVWQHVVLVELDGPRTRNITATLTKSE